MGILRRRIAPARQTGRKWPIQLPFDPRLAEQRFQLLVNAVTDYAIYMLEPDGRDRDLESGRAAVQGL